MTPPPDPSLSYCGRAPLPDDGTEAISALQRPLVRGGWESTCQKENYGVQLPLTYTTSLSNNSAAQPGPTVTYTRLELAGAYG